MDSNAEEDDDAPEAVALDVEKDSSELPKHVKHVPVTLITGFLGSGKTTLVKHILTAQHGLRIAVILNEFGEEGGLEEAFFTDAQGLRGKADEWIELTNGCLCCSVKSNFVQALEGLMARRDKFDCIVVETTGLANPGPIASALWTDEELEAGVQLDSIITVVDGLNISKQVHEPRPGNAVNEAQVQIAFADLVLLNKMDLAEEEAVTRAMADIRAINSSVQIMTTTKCAVDVQQLLHRAGYMRGKDELPPIQEDESAGEGSEAGEDMDEEPELRVSTTRAASFVHSLSMGRTSPHLTPGGGHEDGATGRSTPAGGSSVTSDHHEHDTSITTISLRSDTPMDMEKFKSWVDHLLWDRETHPEEIYRMKGVLSIAGSDLKHGFQAVYELYDVTQGPAWAADEPRGTRITVIGRNLRVDVLRKRFKSLQ